MIAAFVLGLLALSATDFSKKTAAQNVTVCTTYTNSTSSPAKCDTSNCQVLRIRECVNIKTMNNVSAPFVIYKFTVFFFLLNLRALSSFLTLTTTAVNGLPINFRLL